MPTPPPIFDFRWLDTKLYPVIFTSPERCRESVSQVSDTPRTESALLRFLRIKFSWSIFFNKLRAFNCKIENIDLSLKEPTWSSISSSTIYLLVGRRVRKFESWLRSSQSGSINLGCAIEGYIRAIQCDRFYNLEYHETFHKVLCWKNLRLND